MNIPRKIMTPPKNKEISKSQIINNYEFNAYFNFLVGDGTIQTPSSSKSVVAEDKPYFCKYSIYVCNIVSVIIACEWFQFSPTLVDHGQSAIILI